MIEFQSSKPIYMQIVDKLIIEILQEQRKVGDKLPSVREMAVTMGVNPNTIQRTYSELERMNIVETRRGQGTFVRENMEMLTQIRESIQDEIIKSFVDKMEEIGIKKQQMMVLLQKYIGGEH